MERLSDSVTWSLNWKEAEVLRRLLQSIDPYSKEFEDLKDFASVMLGDGKCSTDALEEFIHDAQRVLG